ncbi:Rrf2 family transcriptional regulator [Ensifer adhaerens]|uniref:Rrf2 family transcriptional regulator n=1 Tax=Ensifer adhaerens TaxID=106592 RepID=A0A0L8BL98_ENSAD|nr:Rrf2 family transcriptional regulator [Ensifer adhaerens]KOF15314.1 Rrf2 family transcriptional regulator [Ensifer adhaerens]
MRQDGRLSRLLHVLLHMEKHADPMTSETIARMLGTNSAVVRRTMAGLRDAGYVSSEKGHGGGWTLSRPLSDITLLDVYRTIGSPGFFAMGVATDEPQCLVEQAVNSALERTLNEAETLLLARLGEIAISDIAAEFERRYGAVMSGKLPSCANHPVKSD